MLPDWLQKISGKGCFGSILDFVQTFILFQGFEKNWNVLCRSLFRSLPRATQYVLTITYSFYRIQFKYLSSFSINVPTKYFRLNILLSAFIPLLSRDMFFRMQDREKKRGNYNSRRLNIYHCCFLFSLSLHSILENWLASWKRTLFHRCTWDDRGGRFEIIIERLTGKSFSARG